MEMFNHEYLVFEMFLCISEICLSKLARNWKKVIIIMSFRIGSSFLRSIVRDSKITWAVDHVISFIQWVRRFPLSLPSSGWEKQYPLMLIWRFPMQYFHLFVGMFKKKSILAVWRWSEQVQARICDITVMRERDIFISINIFIPSSLKWTSFSIFCWILPEYNN